MTGSREELLRRAAERRKIGRRLVDQAAAIEEAIEEATGAVDIDDDEEVEAVEEVEERPRRGRRQR